MERQRKFDSKFSDPPSATPNANAARMSDANAARQTSNTRTLDGTLVCCQIWGPSWVIAIPTPLFDQGIHK